MSRSESRAERAELTRALARLLRDRVLCEDPRAEAEAGRLVDRLVALWDDSEFTVDTAVSPEGGPVWLWNEHGEAEVAALWRLYAAARHFALEWELEPRKELGLASVRVSDAAGEVGRALALLRGRDRVGA